MHSIRPAQWPSHDQAEANDMPHAQPSLPFPGGPEAKAPHHKPPIVQRYNLLNNARPAPGRQAPQQPKNGAIRQGPELP